MAYNCRICSKEINLCSDTSKISRDMKSSTIEVTCPKCGNYQYSQKIVPILDNVKTAGLYQKEEISQLQQWVRETPNPKITPTVLAHLFPEQIQACQEKGCFTMNLNDD